MMLIIDQKAYNRKPRSKDILKKSYIYKSSELGWLDIKGHG